ncbi:T9SS type A sorting domain-containing protein [Adhaeribacter soli]|uniref:T9SS type A sorting domain-containing protein n=1 Tax=Adhaeribacter soli TaxID=2607655 RepID=A0A5N1J1V6_9BACT|nr:T9SS type A sorting domain-containing protein [Adhaeribacter soli]KAA9340047.1 T9SS type A sorting domain-containing protein [Adhaeribacter soli]
MKNINVNPISELLLKLCCVVRSTSVEAYKPRPLPVFLLLLLLLAGNQSFADSFTSASGGTWNGSTGTATWSKTAGTSIRTFPNSTDAVEIAAGHTITITTSIAWQSVSVPTGVSNSTLAVNSGVTLTVGTITVTGASNGNSVTQLKTEGPGTISAGAISITGGGGGRTATLLLNTGILNLTGAITYGGTVTNAFFTVETATLGVNTATLTTHASNTQRLTLNAGSTVNFNGANQTIPAITYSNLRISGTGIKTLGGNVTATNITLSNTSSLNVTSGQTVAVSGSLGTGILTLDQASTVNFNGAAQTIPIFNYGTLLVSSSGTKTLAGNVAAKDVTVSAGSLTVTSGQTLSVSGVLSGAGATNFNTGSTVNFNGTSAQTIPNRTYSNIKINNVSAAGATFGMSVTASNVTGNITVESGTLTLSNATTLTGAPLTVNNNASLVVGGAFPASAATFQAGSNLVLNGTALQTLPANTYGNIRITNAAGAILFGPVTVAGNLLVEGGILNNGGYTITGSTGKVFQVNNGASFSLTGATAFPTGFSTYTFSPGSTVSFGQTIAPAIPGYTFGNLAINLSTSNLTATASGALTLAGDLLIQKGTLDNNGFAITGAAGKMLQIGNEAALALGGASSFPDGFSAVSLAGTSKVIYKGTDQVIAALDYPQLQILSTGTKTLAGNASISSLLDLSGGSISIGANALTIKSTGVITNASAGNYIVQSGSGKLIVENIGLGGLTSEVAFPVGTATSYTPAYITNSGAANSFSVNVTDGVRDSWNNPVFSNVVKKTWNVHNETANGTPMVTLRLSWNAADEAVVPEDATKNFDRSRSTISHYENGLWNRTGTFEAAAGNGPYSVSRSGISSFSPFGVGDAGSPLPVALLHFTVARESKSTRLKWATATERNNQGFDVQVSRNGKTFETISHVSSKNPHSSTRLDYEFTDTQIRTGVWYYRLKQLDFDGSVNYSNVRAISLEKEKEASATAWPNPFTNHFTVSMQPEKGQQAFYELTDLSGKTVCKGALKENADGKTVAIATEKLPEGLYMLKVKAGAEVQYFRMLKR